MTVARERPPYSTEEWCLLRGPRQEVISGKIYWTELSYEDTAF
jgi:hypothetical protein